MLDSRITKLMNGILDEDKNCLAQLISLAEDDNPNVPEIMRMLRPHLGKACRIGITGPPGVGKSTLAGRLAEIIRGKGFRVAIIAVDPSSPISGGAMLGDRIRMPQLYLDGGVFIRSMATRVSHGGLSKAVAPTMNLLDAFGNDIIMIETAGVGQTELSIRGIVDILVLVLTPGFGDAIQVMKAGLIEVANIIVVNKADQDGAERLLAELGTLLLPPSNGHEQAVIATQARNGTGVEELYHEIEKCYRNR